MRLTQWMNEYSVGIDEVDDQHKVLINCIANLEQAIDSGDEKQRWSAIHYAIVQLSDYTRVHFSVEESLMRILKYPGCAEHIAQHQVFVKYLADMERRSITQDISEDEIVGFLRNWLLTHILEDDKRYAASFVDAVSGGLTGKAQGSAPA